MRIYKNYRGDVVRERYKIPSLVTVYLMQVGYSDIYKIGHTSKDVSERVGSIRFYVKNIKLIIQTYCSVIVERELHKFFKEKNVHFNGFREYFKLTDFEVNFIIKYFKEVNHG